MILLEFTRWEEDVQFEVGDQIDERRPAGWLAADVLRSIDQTARSQRASVERLIRWTRRGLGATKHERCDCERDRADTNAFVGLIAKQVTAWIRSGRVSWQALRGVGEGPTPELSTPLADRLLSGIEWRGPGHGHLSEVVRAATPMAAVLLSALHGRVRGTLVGCTRCRRLFALSPSERQHQMRCPHCGARRGLVPERVRREYRRAYERMYKRVGADADQSRQLREILGKIQVGAITATAAIAQMRTVVPRNSRGRRATT